MGVYRDLEKRKAYVKRYNEENKERQRAYFAAYYQANRDKKLAQGKAWKEANPDRAQALVSAWHGNPANRERRNAYSRSYVVKRNALRAQRTPAWLVPDDFWMIDQAYELAVLREQLVGGSWHVDHVIPLNGKKVSGLHVPTNLQVIPAVENIRKGNRFQEG